MMPSKKSVAHLTSVHPRFDTRIFLKECTSLANHGYTVSLVVADGKGYEEKAGVTIHDVGASKGRLDRIRNAPGRVLAKALELDAGIYHLHDPELIPIGLKLKERGKVVIFDIHENTDLQILTKDWIPYPLRKLVSYLYSKYEFFACQKFDCLLVPQVSMRDKYSSLAKTEIIANYPASNSKAITKLNFNKYKLLYSGGIGKSRGLFNMLNLIAALINIDERYSLTLAGPISSRDLDEAKKHPGWINTNYLGVLTVEEIYEQYDNHSIGLILFNNVGQYYMAYSLKLFEYMQCGMTVIMPDFGDWLDFNREFGAGFNVNASDSDTAARLLSEIDYDVLKRFSTHNKCLANSVFTWESQAEKLIGIYKELTSAT